MKEKQQWRQSLYHSFGLDKFEAFRPSFSQSKFIKTFPRERTLYMCSGVLENTGANVQRGSHHIPNSTALMMFNVTVASSIICNSRHLIYEAREREISFFLFAQGTVRVLPNTNWQPVVYISYGEHITRPPTQV